MDLDIRTIIGCGQDFEPSFLLQKYRESKLTYGLNMDEFKEFVKSYIDDSIKFEETTGIPHKFFANQANLSLFEKSCFYGYAKVKNIYVYMDHDTNEVVFLRNKKVIKRISNLHGSWLLDELDKIKIQADSYPSRDPDVPSVLYSNKNFMIEKYKSFYLRYYKDSIYDVVVSFRNNFYFFYSDEQIDEYSLMGWGMSKNDLLKLSRMLKLNKIFRKNNKEKK